MGSLFAAEQSQTRQGVVGEHWASLVYLGFPTEMSRLMNMQ